MSSLPDTAPAPCQADLMVCTGTGILRIHPESMVAGQTPEYLVQCLPCYEYMAGRAIRVWHRRAAVAR